MIGCLGVAETREIEIDPNEIADAQWVSRERVAEIVAGRDTEIKGARPGSIARFLLTRWLEDTLD